MNKEQLFESLIPKERNLEELAQQIAESTKSKLIDFLFDGLQNPNARIKYGCINTFVIISEQKPDLLYPYFNKFVSLLESDKKVFKLASIKILCNLTKVDTDKKFDKIFNRIYSLISQPEMTPASNLIKGSVVVAASKPYLVDKIAENLLSISENEYETNQCKNILIGQAIETFRKIYDKTKQKEKIIEFVTINLNNNRVATRNKAAKFLEKYKTTNS